MDFGRLHDLCQRESLTIRENEWVRVGSLGFFDAYRAMHTLCPVCRTYEQRAKYVQGDTEGISECEIWHCLHCNNVVVVHDGEGGPLDAYFPDIAQWEIGRDIKEGVAVSFSMERGIGTLTRAGVVWKSWDEVERDIHERGRQLGLETHEDLRPEREEGEADAERR